MTVDSRKLSPKKQRAIIALLEENSIRQAAVSAGIGEKTLHRWLGEEDFQKVYRSAKSKIVGHAVTRLQGATGQAVSTLVTILNDKDAPPSTRVTASKAILEFAIKSVEMEDLISRIEELEKSIGKKE